MTFGVNYIAHKGSLISSKMQGNPSDYSGPSSGSTACIAIVQNNQLLVANAGDSRCVMSRKGKVKSFCNFFIDPFMVVFYFASPLTVSA